MKYYCISGILHGHVCVMGLLIHKFSIAVNTKCACTCTCICNCFYHNNLFVILVSNPKPFCLNKTPIPQVTDLCLTLEKINLKELSACAKLSAKVKIGPLKPKKFEYEQCFKIPKADGSYITFTLLCNLYREF